MRRKLLGPDPDLKPEKTPEELAAEKQARKDAAKRALGGDTTRAELARVQLGFLT